ncbi:MAG: outer membrane beta-barrel protein [Burkholderiales bacterium]|nr:outer membrane beta-barrel protein [Burkholderiales bacterium]
MRRNELEIGSTWRPSGASTLDAQLSRARDTHSIVAGRNFDSWTGGLSWNWRASGKTGVGLSLKRESSVGSYGDYGLPGLDTGEAKLRTAVNLNTSWEATGKIRLTAGLGYARRNLDGAFSTAASQPTTDTTSSASIGMVYTLLRNVELGCSVAHENRSVGNEASTLTYPYSDTLVRCYGEVFLR